MSQVWNMFDGLPGVPPRIALDNPFLYSQRVGGWGGARVVNTNAMGLGTTNPTMIVKTSGEIATAALTAWAGAATSAGAAGAGAAGAGAAGAGAGTSAFGAAWASAAVPIIGAAIAGVTIAIILIMSRKGPKQKTATTTIVNDIEPQLAINVEGYINGPRTLESYYQALENFKAGWQAVLDNCGDPSMGRPGQNCISERMEGARPQWDACKNSPGGCQNWFELYRDPILANPPIEDGDESGNEDGNWSEGGSVNGTNNPVAFVGNDNTLLLLLVGGGLLALTLGSK